MKRYECLEGICHSTSSKRRSSHRAGVFSWKIGDILLLYWIEAVIVVGYTLIKLAIVYRWRFALYGPLSLIVFGQLLLFMFALVEGVSLEVSHIETGEYSRKEYLDEFRELLPAVVGYTISHGVQFVSELTACQNYRAVSGSEIGKSGIREVFPLGVASFLSIATVTVFGNAMWLFVAVMGLKILLDGAVTYESHKTLQRRAGDF
jgi:hypothetical protein